MTLKLTMSLLYAKLSKLGFSEDYVKNNGLPSWWNDELNNNPIAVLEGAGYISDNFNLNLKSLLEEEIIKENVAEALVTRITELIAYSTKVTFTSLPNNVKELRREILKDNTTINLISQLKYCSSKGIIVGYFNNFPSKIKKFAALIQYQFNSPIIILTSNHKYSANFSFDLAHQLGHLVLEPLKEGIWIDEEIKFNCNNNNNEYETNKFATQLLLGDSNNCLNNKIFKDADDLCNYVVNTLIPQYPEVEAESLILNYGLHNRNYFSLSMKALDKLNCSINSQKIINKYLSEQLDWNKFNNETYEYLEKVLGL